MVWQALSQAFLGQLGCFGILEWFPACLCLELWSDTFGIAAISMDAHFAKSESSSFSESTWLAGEKRDRAQQGCCGLLRASWWAAVSSRV